MKIPPVFSLSLLLGLAPFASAQDTDHQAPAQPSAAARERLAALDNEVTEYTLKWRVEQQELRKKQAEDARKAAADGRKIQRAFSMRMRPDYGAFADRLVAMADEAGGEDAALYLSKAVSLGGIARGSKGVAALDRLVRDHAASPCWKELGHYLPSLQRGLGEKRKAEILAVLAKSPDGDVRGWVAFAAHSSTIETAACDSTEYKVAKAAFQGALEHVRDERLRDQIEGAIDLRERLGVGAMAPDIEGIDLDGVAFKLSDYRGKVIFLDFWGDW